MGTDALCEVNMCFQRESFNQSHINVRCGSGDFSSYLSHPQTPTSCPPIYYTRNKGRGVGWLWRSLKPSVLDQHLPRRLQRRMVSPLYMNQSRRTMQQVCFGFLEYIFLKLLSLFILSNRLTCYFDCRDTPASYRNYPSTSKTVYPHNTACLQMIILSNFPEGQ